MILKTRVIPISVTASPADSLKHSYARVSIPLKRGVARGIPRVAMKDAKGAAVPVQSELLTRWADGSARVLHLTFPSRGGICEATVGGSSRAVPVKEAIRIVRKGEKSVHVSTGRLDATLGGPGLVQSIRLGGREMIGERGIEFRVTDGAQRAFVATADRGVKAEVETDGPLRAVVTLKGGCLLEKERFIDFRLRFEFLAGVEGFSLACTFFNLQRGKDFHDVCSMELELRLAGACDARHTVYQQSHGLFSMLGRMVTTPQPLDIAVDDVKSSTHVRNYPALGDPVDYPFYLNPPCDKIDSWAVVSDGRRAMQVEMDDFHLLRPKSLVLEGDTARFGIWPGWAGVLALQQGRSRQVTVRVAFSDKGPPASQEVAIAATEQLRNVWRAQIPQEVYGEADFFDQGRVLPYRPDLYPRFEQWLGIMSYGLNSVATFFDLGDTPDSGYQSTYIPVGNRIRRVRGEDGGRRYFSTGMHHPATKHNCLDDFEVVWVNNEYDVIYAIGTEYLRTGNMSLFEKLCWWSRHTIDVDFLHYSDHRWLNRAQPAHSERHTSTGAYPSHFWTQGLAQYYMLTGDPDALEVIIALADKTIENLEDPIMGEICSGLNREIGWGILTMICAYEASGLKRFDDYARELLDREIKCGIPDDIPSFNFALASIMLGARQYLEVHRGEKKAAPVRRWVLAFVDRAIQSSRRPSTNWTQRDVMWAPGHMGMPRSGIFGAYSLSLDPIAYAYEITGDRRYIEAGMRSVEAFLDTESFRTPIHEGKPYAMVYRTFINFLKPAADMGLLAEHGYKH